MRGVAASLAAALAALAVAGCGEDGAEPDTPKGATLMLDFQANAVHSGIYAAQARGFFKDEGVELTIREPSSTADGAKLLEAGNIDFAVMDINDFGIARERGFNLVAIAAIVHRPLAAVIAADRTEIRSPADLAGKRVGVTGVPSDDAVLDTVLASAGLAPDSVERITIGFNAVTALAARKIDAATAFWNAEGVELKRLGVPTREFRVDEFGAPRYPELVVATKKNPGNRRIRCGVYAGLSRAYFDAIGEDPGAALDDLLDEVPEVDEEAASAQLDALVEGKAFSSYHQVTSDFQFEIGVWPWERWAAAQGLVTQSKDLRKSFLLSEGCLPPDS
jgi:putative hydroxymethylpyrimidine transport system substrate-binding protein